MNRFLKRLQDFPSYSVSLNKILSTHCLIIKQLLEITRTRTYKNAKIQLQFLYY